VIPPFITMSQYRIALRTQANQTEKGFPLRHSIPPVDDLARRNGGRGALVALAVVLALGLGLRVGEAWNGRPPVYDAAAYAAIAANLERGEGFELGPDATQPASNYSPGVPLLAGGLYGAAGGVHERMARLLLAAIGSLAILFAYLIGRRLSGPVAGLVGAAAIAVYPALLEYQGMLMGEPLAATLLSGAVLAMLWAGDARVRWLLPGALLGALALVRPEYVAIALPIAVVVLARRGWDGWRECGLDALVLLLGLVVIVGPWTIRNAVVLDRFVPVSTGGGQVLFAGAYMPSGGDPERVGKEVLERHPELRAELPPDPRLEQILAALAKQRYPAMEADEALARMGRERLWDDVSETPVEYAGFVAAKLWRIWSHGPRDVMREPVWTAFHLLLVALGLLGAVVLARQRRWEVLLIAVVLLSVTTTGALLVASPRRVLVTIPLVAALAGVAADALWQQRIRH
jgi:dolichyl-phosphate-mannose-protein mannosyltransferase